MLPSGFVSQTPKINHLAAQTGKQFYQNNKFLPANANEYLQYDLSN